MVAQRGGGRNVRLGRLVVSRRLGARQVTQAQGQPHAQGPAQRQRVNQAHVQQAVAQVGLGRDVGVVAVLRGVGEGHHVAVGFQPGAAGPGAEAHRHRHGPVAAVLAQGHPHVSGQAAGAGQGKVLTHVGIKPQSGGAEKRLLIDEAHIHAAEGGRPQPAQRGGHVQGHFEVAGQAVAGALRHDAQRRARAQQPPPHLIDGAVAAHGHHHPKPFPRRLPRQRHGVAGVLGGAHGIVQFRPAAQVPGQQRRQVEPAVGAGVRVENETGSGQSGRRS